MAQSEAIARPYAQAIFELAQADGNFGAWSALLATAAEVVATDEVAGLLDRPGIDRNRVVELIGGVSAADQQAASLLSGQGKNLLRLLAENDRLPALPEIADAFDKLRAEVENMVDVTLTAATPVDEAQQARMIEALKKRFGRDVRLNFVLDESLLGGARLQAEDHVIDGTVRTRLAKLASALAH
ncbi:MAG: F0F1 ATP synthase subunit delta [Deltaproteobacteria bacterium]|nr:F0F1 ATP synthase subunit delta [Deltaproteobacteria bacterium]